MEVPVMHTPHCRYLPDILGTPGGQMSHSKKMSRSASTPALFGYEVAPAAFAAPDSVDSSDTVNSMGTDLDRLQSAALRVVTEGLVRSTPQYILSADTMQAILQRIKAALINPAGSADPPLRVVPCLSVKTQPNTTLVQAARQAGYLAECIDLAEVHHAVLHGGYLFAQVVLTGPAKFWDCKAAADREAELQQHGVDRDKRRLHAVFADSLADLRDVVTHLLDPEHTLDAEVVGLRWAPCWGVASRFGLNSQDPQTLQQAAELLSQLPARYQLGMHFHHASSALGTEHWLGLVMGFVVFCGEFSQLCNRAVAVLDFGGGFEPYHLESERGQAQLLQLYAKVRTVFAFPAALPTIQFELGKCVSEPCGGLLTTVLVIRERPGGSADGKAIVIDSTICDLSVPNNHVVYWLHQAPASTLAEISMPTTDGSAQGHESAVSASLAHQQVPLICTLLAAGEVEIWGRTCMEWDKLLGRYALPDGLRAGDKLLIAGCGAYDISMQYAFGDGVPRTGNVLMV
jgi:diaminopimelate decarboxylase